MSLDYYAGLLARRTRIEAFRRAIGDEVRPDDRVLDLGTGLGTFALFAARAGAGRVWAVDSDPVVHVARTVARTNELDDRIEFLRGRLPDVDLPGRVDLLVYEDFPRRLLDDRTYRLLRGLADEVLASDARILPRSARLCMAPLRSGELRSWLFPLEAAADEDGAGPYDVDWRAIRPYLANQPRSAFVPADAVAGEAVRGPWLPLLPPPRGGDLELEGRWTVKEEGPVHALALWFDLRVGDGGWIGNGPGPETQPWGQVVLPLDPPVPVGPGDGFEARVEREEFSDGAPGWLAWRASSEGGDARGHEFAAYPAALEDLYPEAERVRG